jgi:hypothetical protein
VGKECRVAAASRGEGLGEDGGDGRLRDVLAPEGVAQEGLVLGELQAGGGEAVRAGVGVDEAQVAGELADSEGDVAALATAQVVALGQGLRQRGAQGLAAQHGHVRFEDGGDGLAGGLARRGIHSASFVERGQGKPVESTNGRFRADVPGACFRC